MNEAIFLCVLPRNCVWSKPIFVIIQIIKHVKIFDSRIRKSAIFATPVAPLLGGALMDEREWQPPAGVPACFEFEFHAKHVGSAAHHAQHCASVKLLPGGGCLWLCGEYCRHQPFTTLFSHVSEGFGIGGGFDGCSRSKSSPASRR